MSEHETDSENDSFIIKNSIVFKKYKLIKKLCSGAFGNIYLGYFLHNNSYVAIKTEPRKIPSQHLETEAYFLYTLKGIGIPEVLSYGRTKYYNILVEPLLGKSLYHLYLDNNRHFKIKDICLIGIQILDRLEWIHSKNVIHRDIKPDNFLIGENDPNVLYLIDFGYQSGDGCQRIRSVVPCIRLEGIALEDLRIMHGVVIHQLLDDDGDDGSDDRDRFGCDILI